MFVYHTSEKFKRALAAKFSVWLVLFFLFAFLYVTEAQVKPILTEPFKKCVNPSSKYGGSHIIASDNDNNLILLSEEQKIFSTALFSWTENWVFQSGGNVKGKPFREDNQLFFITTVVSDDDTNNLKSFRLNSLSLKTGIINWQTKIGNYSDISLKGLSNSDYILTITNRDSLDAYKKSDGTKGWTRRFSGSINLLNSLKDDRIGVLTNDRLYIVSIREGIVLESLELKNNKVSQSLIGEHFILLGHTTGEVSKIHLNRSKIQADWTIKTGGSITGFYRIKDKVLVTSLDNFIYFLDLEDGSLRWKKRVSGRINGNLLVSDGFAIVVNENDNITSVLSLENGKVVNQIEIETENYFSGQPTISENFLILQTFKGFYFFVNAKNNNC